MSPRELVSLPAIELAPRLIGWRLVAHEDDATTSVEIHETEAYLGGPDRASHTFGGRRTPRNESMWLAGGHLYVYLIYGMHHCLNVVSGAAGSGEAVLIRAGAPLCGFDAMRRRRPAASRDTQLCSGPGKLAAALGIDRGWDGEALLSQGRIRLEPPGDDTPGRVRCGPRVGIPNAGSWARRRLRFGLDGSKWLSQPPIEGPLWTSAAGLAEEI